MSIKSISYDILVAPNEKPASNAYSTFGPLDQRCFDSSQIFTKYRSHPPCVVSWSRWWVNCICRSSAMSIFVFVCTSSSRLAVRQLKAAFILVHLIQESSCNNDNHICNCHSVRLLLFSQMYNLCCRIVNFFHKITILFHQSLILK